MDGTVKTVMKDYSESEVNDGNCAVEWTWAELIARMGNYQKKKRQ